MICSVFSHIQSTYKLGLVSPILHPLCFLFITTPFFPKSQSTSVFMCTSFWVLSAVKSGAHKLKQTSLAIEGIYKTVLYIVLLFWKKKENFTVNKMPRK